MLPDATNLGRYSAYADDVIEIIMRKSENDQVFTEIRECKRVTEGKINNLHFSDLRPSARFELVNHQQENLS